MYARSQDKKYIKKKTRVNRTTRHHAEPLEIAPPNRELKYEQHLSKRNTTEFPLCVARLYAATMNNHRYLIGNHLKVAYCL